MKVPIQQRSWDANMGLVFLLCFRNIVPLLLVSMLVCLPALTLRYGLTGEVGFASDSDWVFAADTSSSWIFVYLLARPLKQAFCFYVVARCFEGWHVPVTGGLGSLLKYVPSLFLYDLAATLGMVVAFAPAFFLGWLTHNPFLFLVASTAPLAWMFTSLVLGPCTILLEQKGPVPAMVESFALAKGKRLYLLSFLGVLSFPWAFVAIYTFLTPWEVVGLPPEEIMGPEHSFAFLVRAVMILILDMPATIAPVVLYFHLKAKSEAIESSDLAHLVDRIGGRHQD